MREFVSVCRASLASRQCVILSTIPPSSGRISCTKRYSYVNNNPLTFVDPSGFSPCGYNPFCDNGNNTVTFYPSPNEVAVFTNGVSDDYSLFKPGTMQSNIISVPRTPGLQSAYTQFTINYNNRGPTQNGGNTGATPATITTQQAAAQQAETDAVAAQIAAQTQAAVDQANAAAAAAAAQIINSISTPAPIPIQGNPSANGNGSSNTGNNGATSGDNSGGDNSGSDPGGGGGNMKTEPVDGSS
jgi:hypothetical protein